MPKMPANNRMHSGTALKTHGIWANTIGYDPYAPSAKTEPTGAGPATNAYDNYQGLLALARLTHSNSSAVRGTCKKCGGVGHLTFQCRNHLKAVAEDDYVSSTSSDSESDSESDIDDKHKKLEDIQKQSKERGDHKLGEDEKKKEKSKHKHRRSRSRSRSRSPKSRRDRDESEKDREKRKKKEKKHKHKKDKKDKKSKKDKHSKRSKKEESSGSESN